ncbi:MAG: hypothetical protein WCK77_12300 [Verrucomicrobiota bacterium]
MNPHSKRRGFTLIELSLAIMLGMAIGAMTLALFNQQLAFLKIYKAQSFLTEEAPLVSIHVSKLVGKAERFRLHNSVADALAGTNPQSTASPVLVLNFRQPDGSVRAAILSFENRGSGPALYYYVVPLSGVLGIPQWYLTKVPANVSFSVLQGILCMALSGPNGEHITYSGAMTQ